MSANYVIYCSQRPELPELTDFVASFGRFDTEPPNEKIGCQRLSIDFLEGCISFEYFVEGFDDYMEESDIKETEEALGEMWISSVSIHMFGFRGEDTQRAYRKTEEIAVAFAKRWKSVVYGPSRDVFWQPEVQR